MATWGPRAARPEQRRAELLARAAPLEKEAMPGSEEARKHQALAASEEARAPPGRREPAALPARPPTAEQEALRAPEVPRESAVARARVARPGEEVVPAVLEERGVTPTAARRFAETSFRSRAAGWRPLHSTEIPPRSRSTPTSQPATRVVRRNRVMNGCKSIWVQPRPSTG